MPVGENAQNEAILASIKSDKNGRDMNSSNNISLKQIRMRTV